MSNPAATNKLDDTRFRFEKHFIVSVVAFGIVLVSPISILAQSTSPQSESAVHWLKAFSQFRQLRPAESVPTSEIRGLSGLTCPGGVRWKQVGPSPLLISSPQSAGSEGPDTGMVRDIAIDPSGTLDLTIYVATDNGGVWKTTDGGSTWSPKTDFMPSLNMGSIALDPANPSIVYAGTGNEANQGFFKGVGLYRSTNGGETWSILGTSLFAGVAINRIVIPTAGVLLLGTSQGVFRSVDNGEHFGSDPPLYQNQASVLAGNITDLDVDTASNSTIYAAVAGSGVFTSTDGGATFPAAGNLFKASNGGSTNFGFIAFAQSTQPDNKTIYLNVQLGAGSGSAAGVFKSGNRGANWTQIPAVNGDMEACSFECGYAQVVAVDPQDAQRVYVGVRALYMASDGGAAGIQAGNRIDLNKVHADQHALAFSPPTHRIGNGPTHLFNGTDGGLATTADYGSTWTALNGSGDCSSPNSAMATVLFRQIDIGRGSVANNLFTYGAAQDLGISSHRPGCTGTTWITGIGGDGNTVSVDPLDPTHAIGEDGGFTLSSGNGQSWTQPGAGLPAGAVPTLLSFDPNGKRAYAVINNQLYQSTDSAATFALMVSLPSADGTITALNIPKIDSNTIWVGRADGTVNQTSTAGSGTQGKWAGLNIPGTPVPQQGVSGIAVDPFDTTIVIVVYPATTNQVFMTSDSGAKWKDISATLPNLPVRSVVIDPNTSPHSIIIGTDAGVLRTRNWGVSWEILGTGLPTVQCTSLAIDFGLVPSLLRVGTYGRSVFELDYERVYVDWHNVVMQDGTVEHPFRTIQQALDAATHGGSKFINIEAGSYAEAPIYFRTCAFLNAVHGQVFVH